MPVEHTKNSGRKSEGDDAAALERRRVIIAKMTHMQREHRRRFDALGAEYRAIMRRLRWPEGCVVRPRRVSQ